MNASVPHLQLAEMPAEFQECFDRQRQASRGDPYPSKAQRVADLNQLARLLRENRDALVAAVNRDFGNRSEFETLFTEYFSCMDSIKDAARQVGRWMKPQRRHIDRVMWGLARNRVIPQPLGVIGVIVPWNFPLAMAITPLVSIFAAGNRAMVKMSENSPHTSRLLAELASKYFSPDKLQFFQDAGGRGPAFSSLPFDHLIFTGSGQTGRAVMANAARNLTPVTLEMGGKSPAVVAADFSIEEAAKRIMWVKMLNAGQICTNVDYVFVPEGSADAFVAHCRRLVAERYPDLNGPDYTSIIDQRAFDRLQATLDDAQAKGATLVNLAPEQKPDPSLRKFAPHVVLNPTPEMTLSQREIFGPILPVRTYKDKAEVVDYVNAQDRPLAFYPFTHDTDLQDHYIRHIMSGGVTVNDVLVHVGQHDLPFGGVGASGMGHYHGRDGFITFSKLRPVFYQGPFSAVQMLFQPPYAGRPMQLLRTLLKLRG